MVPDDPLPDVPTNPGGTLTQSVSEGGRYLRRDSRFDVSLSAALADAAG